MAESSGAVLEAVRAQLTSLGCDVDVPDEMILSFLSYLSLDTAAEASGLPSDSEAIQLRTGLLDDKENQPQANTWGCEQDSQGRTPRSVRRHALGPAVRLLVAPFAGAEGDADDESTPPPSYARRTASSASRIERLDKQAPRRTPLSTPRLPHSRHNPVSPRTAPYAAPAAVFAAQVQKAKPLRTDRVNRFAQMQAEWRSSPFLSEKPRKPKGFALAFAHAQAAEQAASKLQQLLQQKGNQESVRSSFAVRSRLDWDAYR